MTPDNDNRPHAAAQPRMVPIVGFIAGDGVVTITHPTWRPSPLAREPSLFPNDPREP